MNTVVFLAIFCVTVSLSSAHARHDRIFNGTSTDIVNYPFQISMQLRINDSVIHFCGGSILNERWILTAAHCVLREDQETFQKMDLYVLAGATNKSETHMGQFIRVISSVVPDNHYIEFNTEIDHLINDIALLKLEVPLMFSDTCKAVDLPAKNSTPTGNACVTGWGLLYATADPLIPGNVPDNLQVLLETIIDTNECQLELDEVNIDSNICTFTPLGSSCRGDSGSPLSQNGTVVGIVSWGDVSRSAPVVYTKVSNYIDFINEHINDIY